MFGINYSYRNRLLEISEVIESRESDEGGVNKLFCSLFNFELFLCQKMLFHKNK